MIPTNQDIGQNISISKRYIYNVLIGVIIRIDIRKLFIRPLIIIDLCKYRRYIFAMQVIIFDNLKECCQTY